MAWYLPGPEAAAPPCVPDPAAPGPPHVVRRIEPNEFGSTVRRIASEHFHQYGMDGDVALEFSMVTPAHIADLDNATGYPGGGQEEPWPLFSRCRVSFTGLPYCHLTVKMNGKDLDLIRRMVGNHIAHQVSRMGVVDNAGFRRTRTATDAFRESDVAYIASPPRERGQPPNFVVEVGVSQPLEDLHKAKDWWFASLPDTREEGVSVVLLVKYFPNHLLHFEVWKRDGLLSTVKVVRETDESAPTGAKWVADGPVIIPFELVVLRPMTEATETDFVLDEEFLVELASSLGN